MELSCAICRVHACSHEPGQKTYPRYCAMSDEAAALTAPVLNQARATYETADTRELAQAAARTEAAGYCKETRVQEVMSFARRLGISRLGIASCIGLIREARLLQEILEVNDFKVFSVCCKVGSIPKEEVGLADEDKIRPGQYEALCNPVAQAKLLNEAGTGLNVVIGLCVGHDSLFFQHSEAPVTVLVAKDRVTRPDMGVTKPKGPPAQPSSKPIYPHCPHLGPPEGVGRTFSPVPGVELTLGGVMGMRGHSSSEVEGGWSLRRCLDIFESHACDSNVERDRLMENWVA